MKAAGLAAAGLATIFLAAELQAQKPLAVTVKDSVTGFPVSEAVARLLGAGRVERADRLGRIRFGAVVVPDTLAVAAVGFRPETVLVAGDGEEIEVMLRRAAITLADLTIVGRTGSEMAPAATGSWSVPRALLSGVPPAVEPDPLRALVTVPGVTFSSVVSARPVVRGYDAAESAVRLDGFGLVNPYHIGRVFAAFPLDFTRSVDVAVAPHRVSDAETLAGVIDIEGIPGGSPGQLNGGLDLSAASGVAWYGWRGPLRGFGGVRKASLRHLADALGEELPYDFADGYVRVRIPWTRGRWTELTVFGSRDELGYHRGHDDVVWSNVLVGQRSRVVDRSRWGLDVVASYSRFRFDGSGLDARSSRIDVFSGVEEWRGSTEARGWLGPVWVQAGAGTGLRRTAGELSVVWGDDFAPHSTTTRLIQSSAFASARLSLGPATLSAGGRLDVSPKVAAWQPRLRLSVPLAEGLVASVAYDRAARLYQHVTDPQSEPTLAFFDFWMNAGDSGVATPVVHHLTAETDAVRSWGAVHLGVYLSRGYGLGELRPTVDQRGTTAFRFGDSRTAGLEARVALRPRGDRGVALAVSYALSWSQRRWDDGVWRPWLLDQRHRVRVQAEAPVKRRWRVFALAEARSAQPMTRVAEVFYRNPPPVSGASDEVPDYLYAAEGSARGSGVFWLDVGTSASFRGPGRSRVTVGFAVTNVTFGPVAPLAPVPPADLQRTDLSGGVRYYRLFRLPAIPSITARVEF